MTMARWQFSAADEQGNLLSQPTLRVRRRTNSGLQLEPLYWGPNGTEIGTNGSNLRGNPFTADAGEDPVFFHCVGGTFEITIAKGPYLKTWDYVLIGTAGGQDVPPIDWRGDWDPYTGYNLNNGVQRGGSSWVAIAPSIGIEPGISVDWEDYWQLLAAGAGNFQQDGAGAIERPVVEKLKEAVSILDFGGDNTGTNDNAAALAAALAASSKVRLPRGKYKFLSKVSYALPNPGGGPPYDDTTAFAAVSIEGDGPDATILHWPSGDGLEFQFSSQQHAIHLRGFSLTTGASNGGTGLKVTNSYNYFGTHCAQSMIHNVTFRGDDGYALTKYWSAAVDIFDSTNFDFHGCLFKGASTPAGTGVKTQASNADSYATVFNFTACIFEFLALAYRYGYKTQSVSFVGCFFAQNSTDIYVPSGGGHLQGLRVIGCETYAAAAGDRIYINSDLPNFIYEGNLTAVHAGYRAIALDVANNFSIIGNQFFPDLTGNTAASAIDVDGSVSGSIGVIDGNTFSSTTIGVRLKSGSAGVLFGPGNACTGGMTPVTDAGSNNVSYASVPTNADFQTITSAKNDANMVLKGSGVGGPYVSLDATNGTPGNRFSGFQHRFGGAYTWMVGFRGNNSYSIYDVAAALARLTISTSGFISAANASFGRGAPVTKTADFTLGATENHLINNKSGAACVVTLPSAASFPGREIYIRTIQAQAINSASSNVVPRAGGAAGTAILAGTAGAWALLVSDGTAWQIMASS